MKRIIFVRWCYYEHNRQTHIYIDKMKKCQSYQLMDLMYSMNLLIEPLFQLSSNILNGPGWRKMRQYANIQRKARWGSCMAIECSVAAKGKCKNMTSFSSFHVFFFIVRWTLFRPKKKIIKKFMFGTRQFVLYRIAALQHRLYFLFVLKFCQCIFPSKSN